MNTETIKNIFFVGIGGIGMSALARYLNSLGKKVYGYDKTETTLTKKLVDEGIEIHYVDDVDMIPEGIELVVYTPAIPSHHKELNYFIDNGYEVIKRAELLGKLSRLKKTIAIAGTHGKTTTSATTAHLLKSCGIDVSAFIGGIMSNYGSNYIEGAGDWIVVEADEYDRSFLHLSPDIISVMSLDADHLDIYGNHDVMLEGFEAFIRKVKDRGLVLLKDGMMETLSDDLLLELCYREVRLLEFGNESSDISISNVQVINGLFHFDFAKGDSTIADCTSNLAGRHNIENASIAISVALELGASPEQIKEGLSSFLGIKRRFEKVADGDVVYIDDYAHHPTELKSAIGAAKELFLDKKITGVFQPHLFSRTRDFIDGFAEELDKLDEVILLDIYPAREEPIPGVTSELILEKMKNDNKTLIPKEALMETLKNKNIEVLMTLGAGDIDVFVPEIRDWLQTK